MQNGYIGLEKGGVGEEADAIRVDHVNCRLGNWYYSDAGKQSFSRSQGYRNLEAHHVEVHKQVQEAFELVRMDWMKDDTILDELVERVRVAENASKGVMRCISDMLTD